MKRLQKVKKKPALDTTQYNVSHSYKPALSYFHIMIKKTDQTPVKQTFNYVRWALNLLLVENKLLNTKPTISWDSSQNN